MLTLFTTPKPFTSAHTRVIQRNAIASWVELPGNPEIIMFGDEPGAAEAAREFGLRYEPEVARSPNGIPLLDDLFGRAQRMSTHDVLCYVNCDIILFADFIASVARLMKWQRPFLGMGARWDLDVTEAIDFKDAETEIRLRSRVRSEAKLMDMGTDYFLFRRGFYDRVPSFVIGRYWWDNWLIWRAHQARAAVVSATESITAIHQNHATSASIAALYESPDALRNKSLITPWKSSFSTLAATHVMTATSIEPNTVAYYKHRARAARRVLPVMARAKLVKLATKFVDEEKLRAAFGKSR